VAARDLKTVSVHALKADAMQLTLHLRRSSVQPTRLKGELTGPLYSEDINQCKRIAKKVFQNNRKFVNPMGSLRLPFLLLFFVIAVEFCIFITPYSRSRYPSGLTHELSLLARTL
jgi:hypothetical protein